MRGVKQLVDSLIERIVMTSKLEKQFFQCFGIEPNCKFVKYCDDCTKCGCYHYPQISDHILLELICIWNNACLYLEDNIAPIIYQKITETVLEYFVDIENYRFAIAKQDIKHQVCTLFEEEK